jgi:hypothetical protein
MYSLALIIFVVSEKKAFEHFPIGSNVNLCPTWMFIGWSSTNLTFFVLIWNSKWRLRQDLFNIGPFGKNVSKRFFSETKLPRNDHWKFLCFLSWSEIMIDAQFRFNQCNSFREEDISVFSRYGPLLILWPVVPAILDTGRRWRTQFWKGTT